MRKIIRMGFMLAVTMVLFACGNANTPSAASEKAAKCLIDEDYEGYVDMLFITEKADTDKAKLEEQKAQYAAALKDKMAKSIEKEGKKMTSAKAVSEELSEDGEKATVTMNIKYDDGSEKTDTTKLRKDKDGNWKLDIGK